MNKVHTRINWENYPSDTTPINEDNLNAMDVSIDEIDDRVIEMDASKATKTEVASVISNVTFDEKTGVFTFTRKNGTSFTVNTLLEKIATNFEYDYNTQTLILTLVDGTTQTIDLSELLTQYEFTDSSTINFGVDSSGKVTAKIINGSITDAMLESGYLSKVTTQANTAKTNATKAQSYAVGGTSSRDGEDTDNAKYYFEHSKEIFENIEDTGIVHTYTTSDRTLQNSLASSLKINAIRGNSVQNSYSGKNKLPNTGETVTTNGITYTVNEDKSVTANGTATSDAYYMIATNITIPSGTILNGCPSGGNDKTYSIHAYASSSNFKKDFGNGVAFTEDFTATEVYIIIRSGVTVSNLTFKPMIRLASITDSTYEPYVGGMSSPNPQYSQAINSSGDSGSLMVTSHGKNLAFEKINAYLNENGVIESGNYDMYIVPVVEGEMYSNSTNMLVGGSYVVGYFIEKPKVGSVSYDNSRIVDGKTTHTVPTGYGIRYMTMRATVNTENVQIEKGSTLGGYELPTESTFTIPLSEPLRGIDDVKDEIVKKDGAWGIYRRIKNASIKDIIQAWMIGGKAEKGYQTFFARVSDMLPSSLSTNIASDKFTVTTSAVWDNPNGYLIRKGATENVIYVSVATTDASTVAEMITWTTNNLFNVQYELATPIFEPFADEYQSLFYQLETYDNVTYITTDSEVQPEIEVEYAVTDAGVHMLNNYAKSNLAELKADEANKESTTADIWKHDKITNNSISLVKVGRLVMFSVNFTLSKNGSGGMSLFRLPEGYRPVTTVYGSLNVAEDVPKYVFEIFENGYVGVDGIPEAETYKMTATFICGK